MKPALTAPKSAPPRHTTQPFPSYRFIPGINPHPTRDPQGHSFGHTPQKHPASLPTDWKKNQKYLFGVDLYNAAYWWESHEAWEEIWQSVNKPGDYGQFLQGLIQISAAFLKWQSDDFCGLEKLFALGRGRLANVAQIQNEFMGLDLAAHLQKLDAHFADVLRTQNTHLPILSEYPFLILRA